MCRIYQWNQVPDNNRFNTIFLGNGASIAIHNAFNYASLHDYARLNNNVQRIFQDFETNNFEQVLHLLWISSRVNSILGIQENETNNSYTLAREALIETIIRVHPNYADIQASIRRAAIFLEQFESVININYDLILYWIMFNNNANNQTHHKMKDGFLQNRHFSADWRNLRTPIRDERSVGMVFYPHGSYFLAEDLFGEVTKLTRPTEEGGNFLEYLNESYREGLQIPVFVSEGTSQHKLNAILQNSYLSRVYFDVIPSLQGELLIFGWSLNQNDDHLVRAINWGNFSRVGICVHDHNQVNEISARIHSITRQYNNLNRNNQFLSDILFIDAASSGLWINA